MKSELQREQHVQMKNVEPSLVKSEFKLRDKTPRRQPPIERTKGPPPLRNHLPPKLLNATPVTVVRRKKWRDFTEDYDSKSKSTTEAVVLPGIKDCITARPPMDMDLQGPSVYSYNIPKDKPDMTSFPAYTFGSKSEPDRDGGDRTAWGKEWFSHNYVWLQRTDYDPRVSWPSPAHYDLPSSVGATGAPYYQSPAHSIGKRRAFSLVRKGLENEPAPTAYNYGVCKDRTMSKSSSYTIPQGRRRGTVLWSKRECVPGPGSYEAIVESKCIKPRSAAFSFSSTPRTFNLEKQCTL